MESKREGKQSTPQKAVAAASAAAMLLVLGDGDLLSEIFLRLAFPSTLVRAALVCKRWLRAASDTAFLRRFRDLHPPRLLGCFLSIKSRHRNWRVEFVPLPPPPQPSELAVSFPRTTVSLGTDGSQSMRIMDCRNGSVVVRLYHGEQFAHGVLSPLHPARGVLLFPPLPMRSREQGTLWVFDEILSKEDGNGVSYFCFTMDYEEEEKKATACVYMLQAGEWCFHTSATTQLPKLNGLWLPPLNAFLVDDKIYMSFTVHNIFVLDLASSTFSTIKFPDRVTSDSDVVMAPANGSGFYLAHVKEFQLHIWFHKGGKGRVGHWLLVDTICLRDMCSNLRTPNSTTEGGYNTRVVYLEEVGVNAEFVFLKTYGCVVYLDVRSRAWQKVYEEADKEYLCWIHPLLTIWPPFFPVFEE